MRLDISRLGQIALGVTDVDRAEAFYEAALGLTKLFRFGDLAFFDLAGVRLLVEKTHQPERLPASSVLYLRCADIALAVRELTSRGVVFGGPPNLIAQMDDLDLWMAFFSDPDGNTLALMQEAPKGYVPPAEP